MLAALPYLGAAYLAQGAFKEPPLGLALAALSPPGLGRAWSGRAGPSGVGSPRALAARAAVWRAALVPGVIAAGTIYNYSFSPACLAGRGGDRLGADLGLERARRAGRPALGERRGSARGVIAAGIAIPVLLALPELVRASRASPASRPSALRARAATPASAISASP